MIKKVLIANRGEIAVRIIRSCRELGLATVGVYSEADRKALHVRYADEAYCIGPAPSRESYLNIDNIIGAAKKSGADAIHPGYGFLSENPKFSQRCKEEGIIFIGPSAEAISAMGDKITARLTMNNAGVPVVPGTMEKITEEKKAIEVVREIGLPVMIKASAGGGGKGMRLVRNARELISSFRTAKSEALNAFGDDSVYIEKYIESPHHIEFQILADRHGNVIHLFERECSIQRRHQKVIEETPSPLMTPSLREEMGKFAVAAAKAVNYEGAGTIEFIVNDNLEYFFLEMNTRLQVEHPITERVVGVDLVKEQIHIANGFPLTLKQEDLCQNGHAIQCRIYAEDPDNNFMPQPGIISQITVPLGLGVRYDGYVYEGYEIPMYYDPLISKLISWGKTRKESIDRMRRALYEYKITGVKTNIKFLERIMDMEDFLEGKYNTNFIEKNRANLFTPKHCGTECEDMALIACFIDYLEKLERIQPQQFTEELASTWKDFGRKRSVLRL
ncbi:MAG: acetyl-CoA carboxylase biotin carboxylase subunit [Bacteroidetes bacterium]|nr:acetyl-CoA carboxylase biotin carboxylase subunit [Bacteroidota bacterium]